MSRQAICLLTFVSLWSFAVAIPILSTEPAFNSSISIDGLGSNSSLGREPPGLIYDVVFQDALPIDNLQTNYIIISVMSLLAQKDLQSIVEDQGTWIHPVYRELAIKVEVRPGEPFKVIHLLWTLFHAHIELAQQRGSHYVSARTKVNIYSHFLGYVYIIKRLEDGLQLATFANGTPPYSISTHPSQVSRRSTTTAGEGQISNTGPMIWLASGADEYELSSNMTPTQLAPIGAGNAPTNENLRVRFNYISTVDLGQNYLYLLYGNMILGLLEGFFPDRGFRVRNQDFHIEGLIEPPSTHRTTPPYNTRARSIEAMELTALFTTRQRRFDEIEGSIAVGNTQIMTVSFKRLS